MTLGEVLLAYRRREGITQQELADRAGVSIRTLRDIEHGVARRPNARSIHKLAEAAGLSPAQLDDLPREMRSAGGPVLRIDVLGPLAVRIRGRSVDLKPPMQRRLLGLLALQANSVVSYAEIVDFLWEERSPISYLNLVYTHMSRLRRFLEGTGDDLITRSGAGYRLALTGEQNDLLDFEEQLARADAHRAAGEDEHAERAYERALSLWRGQALADVAPHAAYHPVVAASSRQRLTAVLKYADLSLRRGRHQAVLERLREVVLVEPLHEGLNARLLLALAGSGQRPAALRLFGELRDRLRFELGIEPGPEIREAHTTILRQETAVSEPASRAVAVPAQLPPDLATFTGRVRELGELTGYLTTADAHPTAARVLVIGGTAGVGKSTLAVHWAHRVRHRFPDGQLFYNLHGYSDTAAKTAADALTSFLVALGVPPVAVPLDEEARISLFRSMAADRRLLLVLDNVTGPEQVRPFISANRHSAVVVTSRNDLSGLKVHDEALLVRLDVLGADEAVHLLTKVLGTRATTPALLGELAGLCARLPLALRIAAADIGRGAYGTVRDYVTTLREGDRLARLSIGGTGSTAVEAAFSLSYTVLPPSAAKLFRLLSLVPGPDFTVEAAAALSGSTAEQTREELARLAAAYLVDGYEPGRYRFHDLLRIFAATRAGAEESRESTARARQRLHDWYLLGVRAAAEQSYPHWAKLPLGTTSEGVTAVAHADLTAAAGWLSAEHRNLVAAVHEAARSGPRPSTWLLTDAMRSHFWSSRSMGDWLACAQTAVAVAEEDGNVPGLAAATLALASAHDFQERRGAHALYARALDLADRGAWKEGMSSIRNNLAGHYMRYGQLDDAARSLAEGIELDEEDGRLAWLGVKHVNLGAVYGQLGKLNAAHRQLQRARQLLPDTDGMISLNLGEVCHLMGRHDEALEHLGTARARCEQAGAQAIMPVCLILLAEVHCDLARYGEALEFAKEGLARAHDIEDVLAQAAAHNILGRLHERTRRPVQAAGHYRRALELAGETHLVAKVTALIGLADATVALGGDAAAIARQALELARKRSFRLLEGLAHTALADAALAAGDRAEAVRQGRLAMEIHRETGHRQGETRTLRTLGEADPGAVTGLQT
ncbi:BTAD domain-containing putative transcriptional regulator [Nonomuraea typhae]|uniref:BTAD domain-containing putative transcriptional regulator n=1 Tax=Nonomuraea typhae TaxID=2603600 RepID=A0ABW7YPW6_9ACTN